jgi:hypothetical protein
MSTYRRGGILCCWARELCGKHEEKVVVAPAIKARRDNRACFPSFI